MKNRSFLRYISILLMMVFLTGCSPAENARGDGGEAQEEAVIADVEEYFNSLIDESDSDYQAAPDSDMILEDTTDDEDKEDNLNVIEVEALNKDNGYMQIIPVGESCSVDLNNDGQKDVITYNATTSNIEEYGTAVESFTINGGDYKYTLFLSDQGIHIQDPDLDWYYITDINTRDSYKEIAILDYGANGIPYTYFIRFVGSGTYCLGYVPYFPDDNCFEIKGDGTIESAYDLQLLPNWRASAVWMSGSNQLLSSNLQMREPDLYYLYDNQYVGDVTQLVDLQLYSGRSLSGTATTAKASDAAVTFTQTDDEHWVYMKRADEVEGWIYFENKDTILSGGKKYNKRDVFKY